MRLKSVVLLATSLTIGMASVDVYAQSPTPQKIEKEAPSDIKCNDATFRFLPGDFNFCVARKMWANKDYKDAEQMLLLAAGWGSKPAQHMLGLAYLNGAGVTQDRPLGMAWLDIAAERKDSAYLAVSKRARMQATAEEQHRAEVLRQQLFSRYGDDVAAARAETRFVREMNALAGNPAYANNMCFSGLTNEHIEDPIIESTSENPLMKDGGLSAPSCPPVAQSLRMLREIAEPYFAGWKGKVDVGPLQQVDQSSPRPPSKTPATP